MNKTECRLLLPGDDENNNMLSQPSHKPSKSWQHLIFDKLPPHLQVLRLEGAEQANDEEEHQVRLINISYLTNSLHTYNCCGLKV